VFINKKGDVHKAKVQVSGKGTKKSKKKGGGNRNGGQRKGGGEETSPGLGGNVCPRGVKRGANGEKKGFRQRTGGGDKKSPLKIIKRVEKRKRQKKVRHCSGSKKNDRKPKVSQEMTRGEIQEMFDKCTNRERRSQSMLGGNNSKRCHNWKFRGGKKSRDTAKFLQSTKVK